MTDQQNNDSLDLTTALQSAKDREVKTVDPKEEAVPREQSFALSYACPDGKVYEATLRSRIMDGQKRTLVGRICAEMAGGQPWAKLPPTAAARIYALAIVQMQTVSPPDWLLEWVQQDDLLLESIFDKLTEHESFFFHGRPEEGKADTRKPRISINPVVS